MSEQQPQDRRQTPGFRVAALLALGLLALLFVQQLHTGRVSDVVVGAVLILAALFLGAPIDWLLRRYFGP